MEDGKELLQGIAQLSLGVDGLEQLKFKEEISIEEIDLVEKSTQKTTLNEYLMACHTNLHERMEFDSATLYHPNCGITSPVGKLRPRRLALWDNFPALQLEAFSKMWELGHPDKEIPPQVFCPISVLEQHYESVKQPFECTYVEDIVTQVMCYLQEIDGTKEEFSSHERLYFSNRLNSLGSTDETDSRVSQNTNYQNQEISPKKLFAGTGFSMDVDELVGFKTKDYFIWKKKVGMCELVLLLEYRLWHCLPVEHLIYGFRNRNIDPFSGRAPIVSEHVPEEEKAQYKADMLCTEIAIHVFHNMIENGLEYSYITCGKALVFLHIKREEHDTLYFHLSVPTKDVRVDVELGHLYARTSITQIASFCFMALKSGQRTQGWRRLATMNLERHIVDWQARSRIESVLAHIGPPGASSTYKDYRKLELLNAQSSTQQRTNLSDLLDGCSESHPDLDINTGTKINGANRCYPKKPYCTQDCLAGLTRGSDLDWNCPNIDLHRKFMDNRKHALSREEFVTLVQKQLEEDLDVDCEPLYTQGWRGALFRITLASHGYVFVAKGTVQRNVRYLKRESKIYHHLESLQGTAIPVYLGNIDLVHCYHYDFRVNIVHMLLMSWGGEPVFDMIDWKAVLDTINEVRAAGVDQGDVAESNMLWNAEKQRYMLIDFERACYIKSTKPQPSTQEVIHKGAAARLALQEISPNKKAVLGAQSEKLSNPDTWQKANPKIVNPSSSITTEEGNKENFALGTMDKYLQQLYDI